MSDIEQAAKRQREAAKAAEQPPAPAPPPVDASKMMIDRSIMGSPNAAVVAVFVGFAVAVFPFVAIIAPRSASKGLVSIAGTLAGIVAGAITGMIVHRLILAAARRRVMAIGHDFDGAAYLALLGVQRRDGAMTVRVMIRDVDVDRRAAIGDAIKLWAPNTTTSWDGSTLAITSPSLSCSDTTSTRYGGARRFATNAPLHRWFTSIADNVIARLAREHTLSSLRATVTDAGA